MATVDAELRSLLMHDRFVRGIARALISDSGSVDDVVQDTWWAALTRRRDSTRPVMPWLATVARRFALNTRRGEARRHAREVEAAVPEAIPSTAALVEREAVRRSVVESVFNLAEPLRSTVVLRYFECLPPREIARRTGVPVETVRSRLKRAFALLRVALAPVESDARKSLGPILLVLARGPRLPIAASAAGTGKSLLVGALAMSTGTKTAAAVLAMLLIVGLAIVPRYLGRPDGATARVEPLRVESDAPGPVTQPGPFLGIRPRPSVDTEAASSESAVPTALELEIVGPTGRPASGARVVLHRGGEVLAQGTTNSEGRAEFTGREGDAGLIVLPDGAPVHFATIPLAPGRRRIELPSGASITGRVDIDGGRPAEPVTLTFKPVGDEPRLVEFSDAFRGAITPTCTVTGSGEFEFAGVRPGSEWMIGPAPGTPEWRMGTTSGYRVEGVTRNGQSSIVIPAPANEVVVKLRRLPVVRGRIVAGDRRLPVARADVTVMFHAPANNRMAGVNPRDDGVFSFIVEDLDPEYKVTRLEIEVTGPGGIGHREIALDPAPARDHDLGDIELPAGRTIRYVVRDSDGNPIEGAFAGVRLEADRTSRTDSEGRGSILVGPEVASFRVGALKHAVTEVAIPSPVPDFLPVILQPNGGLEIRVVTNPAAAASFTKVRLRADSGHVVDTHVIGNDGISVAAGATTNAGGFLMDNLSSFDFVPVMGRVVVAGLRPAIPLTVTVLDALEKPLARTVVTLGPAEWKALDLRVSEPARTLRGRVRDPDGKPIAGARAVIDRNAHEVGSRGDLDSRQIAATTDSAGRFVLNGVFESTIDFAVDKARFVPLLVREFELPAEGVEVELTLHSGCSLSVKVVDARGAPIRDLRIGATVEGYPGFTATEKQPGEYVFADFPPNVTAAIELDWAYRTWKRTIAVKGDHVELMKMEATGTLVVDYSAIGAPSADDPPHDLRLAWSGATPGDLQRWVHAPAPGAPQTYEIPTLLPGDYTASLFFGPDVPGRERRSASASVRITAGEISRVVFRKP